MKRSEMLKKLYEASDKVITDNSDENLVDILLDECIKLGMLPPPAVYLKSQIELGIKYEWESEDE